MNLDAPQPPRAWAELEALQKAGLAFEESIQYTVSNLTDPEYGGTYLRTKEFYPYTA